MCGIINYPICVRTNKIMNRSGKYMIKNNIEVDVKVKCIENETTQAQLAETIETTGQYVNRIIKKQDGVVNKTFVQMMEALGYDLNLPMLKEKVTLPAMHCNEGAKSGRNKKQYNLKKIASFMKIEYHQFQVFIYLQFMRRND